MGPIPLRLPNPTVSSAHAPHGRDGTAKERKVGFGIRADSGDSSGDSGGNSGLASPALVVALVIVGLLSLTMFSLFGRRMLGAGRRQRRGQGTDTASETSGRGDDHYVLLADMLGLDVSYTQRRVAQLPRLDDKPKMWDIQVHDRSLGVETHNLEAPWCWGDIMPIAVMVSEGERRRVRSPEQLAPSPVPRRSTDRRTCRLFRWLCRRRHWRTPAGEVGDAVEEQRGRMEEKPRVSYPHKDIQVVVAIAMPCRPRRVSSQNSLEMQQGMDYSIGVQTIPWNDGV